MPFDPLFCGILEYFSTVDPPVSENRWYGAWTRILTTLFPASKGYMVTPPRRIPENSKSHITEGVFEVVKLPIPPLTFPPSRTVLIVKVKSIELWPSGIPLLERQISQETDAAFKGTIPAHDKVYCIGAIGPHWRYGSEKNDDGQDPMPLIDWHNAIHDEASFADFQALVGLVASL